MLKVTVSGSFHRHMVPIYEAVGSLREAGICVLSPSDPRVVDHIGDFLFVASDKLRSIRLVQDRHLKAIQASDFLWVVCPDGYTGVSTSMEVGAAVASGVPVFSNSQVLDSTLGAYITHVPSIKDATLSLKNRGETSSNAVPHVLLDPVSSIENTHTSLDILCERLMGKSGDRNIDAELALLNISSEMKARFS